MALLPAKCDVDGSIIAPKAQKGFCEVRLPDELIDSFSLSPLMETLCLDDSTRSINARAVVQDCCSDERTIGVTDLQLVMIELPEYR